MAMDIYPPGIPDDEFVRGQVPMTKAEVRAITMAKARLRPHFRVLDIGAGTGSLTVEAAMLCPHGEVVAVERDEEALALLRENIAHFSLKNVNVVPGEAPDILKGMQPFDRILVGGSGGRLVEIIESLPTFLTSGGRVITNTICLESTCEIMNCFRKPGWKSWDIVQVTISRGVPVGDKLVRFDPLSPVWVVSAELEDL